MNKPMRMARNLRLHVGDSLRDLNKRVLNDVARFEHGESVESHHLSFENWQALFNILTPKRYELLRHVHQHPDQSIRGLARALGRDYKHVHADVKALAEAGLLQHDGEGIRAEYDAIELPKTRIAL
jgi:predicted transcriptional regulator